MTTDRAARPFMIVCTVDGLKCSEQVLATDPDDATAQFCIRNPKFFGSSGARISQIIDLYEMQRRDQQNALRDMRDVMDEKNKEFPDSDDKP